MTEKKEIDVNKPLNPGDVIEMHFRTFGGSYMTATLLAIIDYRLEGQKGFRVGRWTIPGPHSVIFTVRVLETNPILETAAIIAAMIIGVGVVAWLTLDKVYQLVESPAGQIGIGGFGILAAVAAVAIILSLLQTGKK